MLSNSQISPIEKAIDIFLPEIPSLPEVTLEEEWAIFCDRLKKQKISITGKVIEIFCNYEAIAMILCDRLIQDNSVFLGWGIEEIHIFFGDRPPTKIYVD